MFNEQYSFQPPKTKNKQEPKTQNPEPGTQNPEPETRNHYLRLMSGEVSFSKNFARNKISDLFIILLGAIVLCSHAIYNGFPLVYPDTGTYISACFEHFLPRDRPLVYSFFIRHVSLATSTWIPVFLQSAIISWLVFLLFVPELTRATKITLCILFIFSVTTHLSHLPLALGIAVWALAASFIFRKRSSTAFDFFRSLKLLVLIPAAILFVCILNFSVAG